MKNRPVLWVLIVTLLFSCVTVSAAADDILLYINGQQIACDVPPQIVNDRALVPVRAVFEGLNAEISWNDAVKQATIVKDDVKMVFTAGSNTAVLNGTRVLLDAPPVIISDRCLVPIRFISEALGCEILWDNPARAVRITTPAPKPSYTISDISLDAADTSGNRFAITTDNPNLPEISTSQSPYCIILDFYDTAFTFRDGKVLMDTEFVKELRYAQHDGYARVVMECTATQPYNFNLSDGVFKIHIGQDGSGVQPGENETEPLPPAAEPEPETPAPQTDLEFLASRDPENLLVVVDAGHGGKDPGAVAKDENGNLLIQEKDPNLSIALSVYQNLTAAGVNVKMTRDTDKYLELSEITDIANAADADLFVSVHCNSVEGNTANGMMVLYNGDSTLTKYGITGKEVASYIREEILKNVDVKDLGLVSRPGLWVLRKTAMPATLVECAFVSNAHDRALLLDPSVQAAYGKSIADGIIRSLSVMKQKIYDARAALGK